MNDVTTSIDPAGRLATVRAAIADAARHAGRDPDDVTLVGVGKRHPADAVIALAQAGLVDFAENYVDEALEKIPAVESRVPDLAARLTWHYIGRIQSNKTRAIAEAFDVVHSLDRVKIAERLSGQRPEERPPLVCLIEVNVSGESTKGGVPPEAVPELAAAVAALPGLSLRGLMALPAPDTDERRQHAAFERVRALLDTLPDTTAPAMLSMGTTADFPAAIAAGATHVRIGTLLFGPRE